MIQINPVNLRGRVPRASAIFSLSPFLCLCLFARYLSVCLSVRPIVRLSLSIDLCIYCIYFCRALSLSLCVCGIQPFLSFLSCFALSCLSGSFWFISMPFPPPILFEHEQVDTNIRHSTTRSLRMVSLKSHFANPISVK